MAASELACGAVVQRPRTDLDGARPLAERGSEKHSRNQCRTNPHECCIRQRTNSHLIAFEKAMDMEKSSDPRGGAGRAYSLLTPGPLIGVCGWEFRLSAKGKLQIKEAGLSDRDAGNG